MKILVNTNILDIFGNQTKSFIVDYIGKPFITGIYGFAIFFSVLIGLKLFSYIIGTNPIFEIDINDIVLAAIGFVLNFLIRVLESVKNNNESTSK